MSMKNRQQFAWEQSENEREREPPPTPTKPNKQKVASDKIFKGEFSRKVQRRSVQNTGGQVACPSAIGK